MTTQTTEFLPDNTLAVLLMVFTRQELRDLAKKYNIPRGQNKSDTINNLVKHKYDWFEAMMFSISDKLIE